VVQHRFASFAAFSEDRTLDLSEGGLFLQTNAPRNVGDSVYFQLLLQNGARLVEGLGRVVRVVGPNSAGRPAGMGVAFVNMDELSRELIRQMVHRSPDG
jgi:uncharacterized protein (TIGR02266 family)